MASCACRDSASCDRAARVVNAPQLVPMLAFLVRRVATIVPTLIFVSLLIFGLQQLLPGDPAMILAGEERDPTVIAHLRETMHLDEPFPVRYLYWVRGVVRGDLGE